MRNRNIAIIVVLLILLVVVLAFFNPRSEGNIKKEIELANYCNAKSDCVDVGGKCPFGCYVFVNKNESQRIETLINSYESTCVYSCIALQGFDCVESKCQPIFSN